MKKLKEALFFIISLILLIFGSILLYAIIEPKDQIVFVSNWHYIKLLFQDGVFFKAIVNTYTIPICVAFAVALALLLVHFFIKKGDFKKRRVFYPVCLASASASAFACIVAIFKFVSMQTPIFSLYNYLLSLQVGFVVTFLIWIIELIIQKFRR